MAVQLTLTDISSGYQGSDIQANFTAIEDEFDKVLYRDGSLPITDTIDMNSQRLVNLPAPTSSTEPLRKDDQFTTDEAQQFATDAETAKTAAETAETNAEAALATFNDKYYGAEASDPTTNPSGNAPSEGDLYFDSTNDVLKTYDGSSWIISTNALTTLQDYSTVVVELGGGFDAGDSIQCLKIGPLVTITATSQLTYTSGSTISSTAGVIPAAYRPSSSIRNVNMYSDAGNDIDQIQVSSNGTFSVEHVDFSGTSTSEVFTYAPTITYIIT